MKARRVGNALWMRSNNGEEEGGRREKKGSQSSSFFSSDLKKYFLQVVGPEEGDPIRGKKG